MPGSRRDPTFKEKSDFLSRWLSDPQTYPDEFKAWLRSSLVQDPNIVWEQSQIPTLPGSKIQDGTLTGAEIQDGSIQDAELATGISGDKIQHLGSLVSGTTATIPADTNWRGYTCLSSNQVVHGSGYGVSGGGTYFGRTGLHLVTAAVSPSVSAGHTIGAYLLYDAAGTTMAGETWYGLSGGAPAVKQRTITGMVDAVAGHWLMPFAFNSGGGTMTWQVGITYLG